MIAFGDCDYHYLLGPYHQHFSHNSQPWGGNTLRHLDGWNKVYCDGHVEYDKGYIDPVSTSGAQEQSVQPWKEWLTWNERL